MQETPKPIPLRPLGDHMIIKPVEAEAMTAGDHGSSLHIPERAQDERCNRYGHVVAVGGGRVLDNGVVSPPPAQLGDLVAYPTSWRGREFEWEGETYRALDPDDAIAVVAPGTYLENTEL